MRVSYGLTAKPFVFTVCELRLKRGVFNMNTGLGRIIVNCASILTGNFLNKFISIAVLACLTGFLSPSEFGRYSFVISYIAFFGIFTDLGINTLLTRDISGKTIEASEGFGHAIAIRFIYTVATVLAVFASLWLMGYASEIMYLAAAASLSLFFSFRGFFFRTVFDIPFQVNLKMGYPAVVNFLNEVLTLGVIVVLVYKKATLLWLLLAVNIVNLPWFIAMAYLSLRQIKPSFSFDGASWRRIIRESMPLGLASLLEGVFILIPVFLLSRIATDEAIGFYSLPFRLVASLWIVPVAVMVSLLPKMSRDAVFSENGVRDGFVRGLKLILLAGVPMALITDYYAEAIIGVFTDKSYADSARALRVMGWGALAYFINTVFYYTFAAAGKQRFNMAVWGVNSAVCVAGCLVLIPLGGYMGAAISFSIALGAGLVCNVYFAYRGLGINVVPVVSKFALSGAISAAIFFLIPALSGMSAPLGVGFYLSALFFTKAVSVREWGDWVERGESRK